MPTGVRGRHCAGILLLSGLLACTCGPALAASISLKDGRILDGKLALLSGIADNPMNAANGNAPNVRRILMVDDDLRRTFVPKVQAAAVNEADSGEVLEKIRVFQRVAAAGARIGHVGDIVNVTPWDEFGRRIFSMSSEGGQLDVIQGITLITPRWTKVEGIASKRPFVWDYRMATSSIPRETLNHVLRKQIDPKNLNQRNQLVRLFLQSERYQDAQKELEGVIQDFPEQAELKTLVRELQQLHARKIIDEIKLRRRVGQHRLAYNLLESFPKEDVAGETLQIVREMLAEYTKTQEEGTGVLKQLEKNLNAIKDPALRPRCQGVYDEIVQELNINTLDRMADVMRLGDDDKMGPEEKFALAVSGWLLGPNKAVTNLPVSLSMFDVRNLVRQYLNETGKLRRATILQQIKSQEGGTPRLVADIVAHMKPPVDTPLPGSADAGKRPADGERADGDKAPPPAAVESYPGYYELVVPGLDKEVPVTYYVQLPPEYDPYRRHPTVVTLNGAGTTPAQQLDWWAGARDSQGNRLGQATRQGYIVLAVDWCKAGQKQYEFSAREHAAVLSSLRDATRRFAIDTDRVFLSGHSIGGDAVWDIGLAHPDMWAGVIPVVATAHKYVALYWQNEGLVPFYFVGGELDGSKTVDNARDLDRYLTHQNPPFDVTVVEYLGRGHEHFHDEVQRIFDWMGRRTRNFFPRSFGATTMRTWDNYFWWLELAQFPAKGIIEPIDWPPPRGYQPVRVEAKLAGNTISIKTGAGHVTVWLSPELVDFDQQLHINVNGQRLKPPPREVTGPDLLTLLEDVRTRGERLHPFWLKLEQ